MATLTSIEREQAQRNAERMRFVPRKISEIGLEYYGKLYYLLLNQASIAPVKKDGIYFGVVLLISEKDFRITKTENFPKGKASGGVISYVFEKTGDEDDAQTTERVRETLRKSAEMVDPELSDWRNLRWNPKRFV